MGIKRGQSNKAKGCGRLLVTVTVYGSAGPLRFLVNEGEMASGVLRMALKTYAREGRLPVLGTDLDEFLLYHANGGFDALEPGYVISITGARNFFLCKKQIEAIEEKAEEKVDTASVPAGKKGNLLSWKSGGLNKVNKLLSFRNFFLCKKQIEAIEEKAEEKVETASVPAGKKGSLLSWKSGGLNKVNKLLSFRI